MLQHDMNFKNTKLSKRNQSQNSFFKKSPKQATEERQKVDY